MKKIIILFFSLVMTFFFSGNVSAQDKPQVKIVSVKQNGKTVDFNLTSSKPFIFANNRYYLYVGNKDFYQYRQSKNNGKGAMTFLVPAEEYKNFKEGDDIYLTYGHVFRDDGQNRAEVAQANRRCWSLGQFSSALHTK